MGNLIGHTLQGRYEIREFIGQGGMAEVYKVWDRQRAVHLAMKVLRSDLALDDKFLRYFRREANILAHLHHPNIVRFYELGQEGHLAFFLMDYIEGRTLKDELLDTPWSFPLVRVREIMRQACSALNFAHSQGLIHCDIKPTNILLRPDGMALVTDFGIAHLIGTTTAKMVGTPAYMAPEQIQGEEPTPQTDIYAMGVVLYEMLTHGERLFTGERAQIDGSISERVCWEQLYWQPPPPRCKNPAITAELEAVIMRSLAKEPRERYPSALNFLDAFEKAINISSLSGIGNATHPANAPKLVDQYRYRQTAPLLMWIAGLLITFTLLSLGIFLFGNRRLPPLTDSLITTPRIPLPPGVTQLSPEASQWTKPVSACMSITVVEGIAQVEECVTGLSILPSGEMRVDFSWTADIVPNNTYQGIEKSSDADNHGMYLIDSQGNRLDHIGVGGAAAKKVLLRDGLTVRGWFLFPRPSPDARWFMFYDADNGTNTPPFPRP